MIAFDVVGEPAPKGSMKIRRGGRGMTNDNSRTKSWQQYVEWEALKAMRESDLDPYRDQAMTVYIEFCITRPPSHYTRAGLVKKASAEWPQTKPDLDKLTRAVLDALEGVVYDNDSRVVCLAASKRYCDADEEPGASVRVEVRDV